MSNAIVLSNAHTKHNYVGPATTSYRQIRMVSSRIFYRVADSETILSLPASSRPVAGQQPASTPRGRVPGAGCRGVARLRQIQIDLRIVLCGFGVSSFAADAPVCN